ncbi:MAG: YihY/virulence factor BrkB family protein, partial [Verrucomicrobia bacterium]|nr:YihY/virulence factor BrkB family protein [Verrucomicrobiota bacterium]
MADDVLTRLKRLLTGVQRAWNGQADAGADVDRLSALESFVRFWGLTVKSFARNRVPVRAAALAYSSLLALVPMLALVLSVGLGFLQSDTGQKHIEDFIHRIVEVVVPKAQDTEDAQQETVKNLTDFVTKQQTSAVSASAFLVLVFIAIMMLSRIEDTFNDIWGVERGRGWFARVSQYWLALSLGPVLLLLVIGLTSSRELQSVN